MEREYLRDDVLEYAYEWAYKRNPSYYDYDGLGGDCTNKDGDFSHIFSLCQNLHLY